MYILQQVEKLSIVCGLTVIGWMTLLLLSYSAYKFIVINRADVQHMLNDDLNQLYNQWKKRIRVCVMPIDRSSHIYVHWLHSLDSYEEVYEDSDIWRQFQDAQTRNDSLNEYRLDLDLNTEKFTSKSYEDKVEVSYKIEGNRY